MLQQVSRLTNNRAQQQSKLRTTRRNIRTKEAPRESNTAPPKPICAPPIPPWASTTAVLTAVDFVSQPVAEAGDRDRALGVQYEVICSGLCGVLHGDAGFQRGVSGAVLEPREPSTSLTITAGQRRPSSAQSYQPVDVIAGHHAGGGRHRQAPPAGRELHPRQDVRGCVENSGRHRASRRGARRALRRAGGRTRARADPPFDWQAHPYVRGGGRHGAVFPVERPQGEVLRGGPYVHHGRRPRPRLPWVRADGGQPKDGPRPGAGGDGEGGVGDGRRHRHRGLGRREGQGEPGASGGRRGGAHQQRGPDRPVPLQARRQRQVPGVRARRDQDQGQVLRRGADDRLLGQMAGRPRMMRRKENEGEPSWRTAKVVLDGIPTLGLPSGCRCLVFTLVVAL